MVFWLINVRLWPKADDRQSNKLNCHPNQRLRQRQPALIVNSTGIRKSRSTPADEPLSTGLLFKVDQNLQTSGFFLFGNETRNSTVRIQI